MARRIGYISKINRLILINQIRILESLYPNESESLRIQREIYENGYELLYDINTEYVSDGDEIMTVSECKEVWDTLDMFAAIKISMVEDIKKIEDDTKKGFPIKQFEGYDGNIEGKFMSFAQFMVERLDRFTYSGFQNPGYWNSHFPRREYYQRMLGEWRSIPSEFRFKMKLDQLVRVLEAARNVDHD